MHVGQKQSGDRKLEMEKGTEVEQWVRAWSTGRPMKSFLKLHMVHLQCEFTLTTP